MARRPPVVRDFYDKLILRHNYTNGIPKHKMYIKLAPNVSVERRNFLVNSLHSFFPDQSIILIDKRAILSSIASSTEIFQIFVMIVGTIALLLAFFLLLISTTSNVRENVWEYGCLRAMGLTK